MRFEYSTELKNYPLKELYDRVIIDHRVLIPDKDPFKLDNNFETYCYPTYNPLNLKNIAIC